MSQKEKTNSLILRKRQSEMKLIITIANIFIIPVLILLVTYFFFGNYQLHGCFTSLTVLLFLIGCLIYIFVQNDDPELVIKDD